MECIAKLSRNGNRGWYLQTRSVKRWTKTRRRIRTSGREVSPVSTRLYLSSSTYAVNWTRLKSKAEKMNLNRCLYRFIPENHVPVTEGTVTRWCSCSNVCTRWSLPYLRRSTRTHTSPHSCGKNSALHWSLFWAPRGWIKPSPPGREKRLNLEEALGIWPRLWVSTAIRRRPFTGTITFDRQNHSHSSVLYSQHWNRIGAIGRLRGFPSSSFGIGVPQNVALPSTPATFGAPESSERAPP